MKKFKWLLPTLMFGTMLGVATPLIVSCKENKMKEEAKKEYLITYWINNDFDISTPIYVVEARIRKIVVNEYGETHYENVSDLVAGGQLFYLNDEDGDNVFVEEINSSTIKKTNDWLKKMNYKYGLEIDNFEFGGFEYDQSWVGELPSFENIFQELKKAGWELPLSAKI